MRTEIKDKQLELHISDRLDMLTAPDVLNLFERLQTESTIESVRIDCERLRYISSAGIRVIMIMAKSCPGGVTIVHASPTIANTMKQTSLDTIVSIL